MKVMISTDMEGITGVVDFEQVIPGTVLYEEARRWLTQDINAAVEGCLDGGADEIVITDSHAMRLNILFEDLHPEAQVVMSGPGAYRPQLVMESIDRSYDLALLVGMHAAAHYPGGVLSHSYHGPARFFEVRINGVSVGEPEIAAALAGAVGVPCGLITGDDVTIEEFRKILPGIETVIVKYALDRTAARCLSLRKTRDLILAAAKRAVERGRQGELEAWTFDPPLLLEIVCGDYGLANRLSGVPRTERLDRRTIGFRSDSYMEMYEALMTFTWLSNTEGLHQSGSF